MWQPAGERIVCLFAIMGRERMKNIGIIFLLCGLRRLPAKKLQLSAAAGVVDRLRCSRAGHPPRVVVETGCCSICTLVPPRYHPPDLAGQFGHQCCPAGSPGGKPQTLEADRWQVALAEMPVALGNRGLTGGGEVGIAAAAVPSVGRSGGPLVCWCSCTGTGRGRGRPCPNRQSISRHGMC